ncbi:hypothetical protein MCOR27_008405 [Pyricularia oryzae]|uniref:AMP-dependent synthetase/ligase domain-containing protein n=3 Tax=Pyricularia TaxID=48558 RepID=A0ABQ8NF77_PYRGI|nr:acetoacetate-CoA ligase [Pyricularia oryzae 70-15]KAH8847629.1 hypothetical protein MCOR01_001041 [Pyricularia oryzae]KAI6295985.1 hypothetical protein MCOR33_007282 [Pyricularia grisea]EHA52412.1 acetoacetate-CoA ligase [Pyricularia oryzae 70-15]KAH9430441.1 hypothetical protein MCOR02_010144 [Pyricularia oryzae]KAI6255155.1 hypothetical protein MCOR19_008365 [Pyricularia oryzae]
MDPSKMPKKLWEHPDPKSTAMWQFMQRINDKHNAGLKTFRDLHRFSITRRGEFWSSLWDAAGYIHEGTHDQVVDFDAPIDSVPRWFEGVRLNWAENTLYSRDRGSAPGTRSLTSKEDDKIAVTEVREGASEIRDITWGELRRQTGELAAALAGRGVKRGDRVVIVGANSIETLLVWLATAWLGAIFSSSSTDMGVDGILQRTVQINPKVLFMDDAALYNGKVVDLREKMTQVVSGLKKDCSAFAGAVAIPRFQGHAKDVSKVPNTETWASLHSQTQGAQPPPFTRIPFHEPFLVCYSSGTTGAPKAIVHTVGGLMLSLYKEGALHEGLGPDSVTLQFTTTGWIMYVTNIGVLVLGARAILYDGSPLTPDPTVLIKILSKYKATKLGTSPRWMLELAKRGISPKEVADLSSLKIVLSTGMVLSDQLFEWFYEKGFPAHTQLANISGGTDIAGCFGIMNPLEPVYIGGTQGPSLGIDVRVYDALEPNGPGKEVPHGTPGELVAVNTFPNIPAFFWGDKQTAATSAPPGSKYHGSYFARFDHVWSHGDFVAVHPMTGGIHFLGRADGVLNPSGVRFGSAEIYGVIERRFADAVVDSLCVGQRRPQDSDESVMLFLLMRPGHKLDGKLEREVRHAIGEDLSKRHVPKYIFETPEIPTTVNLKKVELPVKQIVSGQKIKPSGTLANPKSLDFYYQFAKVEDLVAPKAKL